MSTPPLLPVTGTGTPDWGRKAANLVNRIATSTQDSGPTTGRPNNANVATFYYDTDLKMPLWFDGTAWRDAASVVR